jgi:uncharacterized protein (DUF1330 family)
MAAFSLDAREESRSMPVYFIVQEAIHDATKMAEYGPKARAAPNAGKVIAAGAPQAIEGDWHGDRLVVIEFADEAAFRAWYDSPAYQEALRIRLAATDSRAALIQGVG